MIDGSVIEIGMQVFIERWKQHINQLKEIITAGQSDENTNPNPFIDKIVIGKHHKGTKQNADNRENRIEYILIGERKIDR